MRQMKRIPVLLGAAAVVGMATMSAACSPRTEKPADKPASSTEAPSPAPEPTEKGVRTNVTRAPMSVSPGGAGGNPAVPCGFGPSGGLPCSSR